MDRRVAFFLLAAIVGFALSAAVDNEHRWVALGVGVAYVVLAVLAHLDRRTRDRLPPRYSRRR